MSQQLDTIQVHYVHAGIDIDIHMLSVDIIFSTIKKLLVLFHQDILLATLKDSKALILWKLNRKSHICTKTLSNERYM